MTLQSFRVKIKWQKKVFDNYIKFDIETVLTVDPNVLHNILIVLKGPNGSTNRLISVPTSHHLSHTD